MSRIHKEHLQAGYIFGDAVNKNIYTCLLVR